MILPYKLPKKGTIGVVTTSSPVNSEFLHDAINYYEGLGYTIVLGESVTNLNDRILASSSPEMRANEINAMFANDKIDAIMSARGGYGAQAILPYLNYDLIARNPKPFVGFSDVTAVLNAITRMTGMVTFLGPTFEFDINSEPDKIGAEFMLELISNPRKSVVLQLPKSNAFVRRMGKPENAFGILYGGNLTLISRLTGTKFSVPSSSDTVIALEDVGEGVIAVDSMLQHLEMANVISETTPLIFGDFTHINSEANSGNRKPEDGDPSINNAIVNRCRKHDAPILVGLPFSHGMYNLTLPIGGEVMVSYDNFILSTIGPVVR